MKAFRIAPALAAIGFVLSAAPTLADDPNDPEMRKKAAREADAAEIRRLNMAEAAYVQRRDAEYAIGWRAWDAARTAQERRMATARPAERSGYAPRPEDDYQAWRDGRDEKLAYTTRHQSDYERDVAAYNSARRSSDADREVYSRARSDYAQAMASWRSDVSACRAGDFSRCDR